MEISERIKEMIVAHAPEAEIAAGGPRGGDADPARGRPRQGPRGRHQPRGGPPCHQLSLSAANRFKFRGRDDDPKRHGHGIRLRRGARPHGRGQGLRRPPHRRASRRRSATRARSQPMEGFRPLTAQETREVVYSILNDDQRKRFENNKQLDFAYAIPGVARFRVNCFFQRGSVSAAFRLVPQEIPRSTRSACRRCCASLPANRAASSSSPARPARASRRRWRR